MTGRRGRMVRGRDGYLSYELRAKEESMLESCNVVECGAFMKGEKLVRVCVS